MTIYIDTKYSPIEQSMLWYLTNASGMGVPGVVPNICGSWLEFSGTRDIRSGWSAELLPGIGGGYAYTYYSANYVNIPNKFSISPTIEDILAGVPTTAYGYNTGAAQREAQAYATDAYTQTAWYGGDLYGPYQKTFWESYNQDTSIQAAALFYGADEFSATYVDNSGALHGAGSYGELAGDSGEWNYDNFDEWDLEQPRIDPSNARPYIHGVWIETINHPGVNMSDFGMYMWIAVAVGIILLSVELNRRRK
jgi:hypothetical protein